LRSSLDCLLGWVGRRRWEGLWTLWVGGGGRRDRGAV
jgi:hypothetical protein